MGKRLLTSIALAVGAAAAMATVTFDAATGTGFVGKGDVQLAFGWNDAGLQSNASGLSFTYLSTHAYEATCTWTTGEGKKGEKTHNVDHTRSVDVNATVAYGARANRQGKITGFDLTGWGTVVESGVVPVIGGPCPGNEGHDGVWTAVTDLGAGEGGGLYVNYGGTSVLLQ